MMSRFSFNIYPTFLFLKSVNTERKRKDKQCGSFIDSFSSVSHKIIKSPKNPKDEHTISSVKTDRTNSYKDKGFYKITQNIRNGFKLTDQEIEYIESLHKDDLLELILVFDECTQSYTEMIKELVE
jgi:hypothetical protein